MNKNDKDQDVGKSDWSNSEGYLDDNRSERAGSSGILISAICIVLIVTAMVIMGGRVVDMLDRSSPARPVGSSEINLDILDSDHAITDNGLSELEIYKAIESSVVRVLCYDRADNPLPSFSATGLIISGNGYIITNYSHIRNSVVIEVELSVGAVALAELVGYDALTDIALLKIARSALPAVALSSAAVNYGERIFAIGNAYGSECSVVAGVVSNRSRVVASPQGCAAAAVLMIQTDISVRDSFSGGFLFNRFGELTGMFTTAVNSELYGGAVFAVPVSMIERAVFGLVADGRVTGRYATGLRVATLTDHASARMGLPNGGLLVLSVSESSDLYGRISAGDVIIKFDGESGLSVEQFINRELAANTKSSFALTVWRAADGETINITAQLVADDGRIE